MWQGCCDARKGRGAWWWGPLRQCLRAGEIEIVGWCVAGRDLMVGVVIQGDEEDEEEKDRNFHCLRPHWSYPQASSSMNLSCPGMRCHPCPSRKFGGHRTLRLLRFLAASPMMLDHRVLSLALRVVSVPPAAFSPGRPGSGGTSLLPPYEDRQQHLHPSHQYLHPGRDTKSNPTPPPPSSAASSSPLLARSAPSSSSTSITR